MALDVKTHTDHYNKLAEVMAYLGILTLLAFTLFLLDPISLNLKLLWAVELQSHNRTDVKAAVVTPNSLNHSYLHNSCFNVYINGIMLVSLMGTIASFLLVKSSESDFTPVSLLLHTEGQYGGSKLFELQD